MVKKISAIALLVLLVVGTTIPAFAAEIAPSVESNPAPVISTITNDKGEEVAAVIKDDKGEVLSYVATDAIALVPVSAVNGADVSTEVKQSLTSAQDQIKKADDVSALVPGSAEMKTVVDANKGAKLVVRDLFDVAVNDEMKAVLNSSESAYLDVTFTLTGSAKDVVAVLHNVEGTNWEVISGDELKADGSKLTVRFYSLSPVAFVYTSNELPAPTPDAPTSPQTGNVENTSVNYAFVAVLALVSVAAVVCFKAFKKTEA